MDGHNKNIHRQIKQLNESLTKDINTLEESLKCQLEFIEPVCIRAGLCYDLQKLIEKNIISLQTINMQKTKKHYSKLKSKHLQNLIITIVN